MYIMTVDYAERQKQVKFEMYEKKAKGWYVRMSFPLDGTYSAALDRDLAETEVETMWMGGAWIIRPSSLPTLISSGPVLNLFAKQSSKRIHTGG